MHWLEELNKRHLTAGCAYFLLSNSVTKISRENCDQNRKIFVSEAFSGEPMFSARQSFYDLSLICDNSIDRLSSYSEEGFTSFSFSDLILPLTPSCLNENPIEMPLKSPLPLIGMFPMDKMSKDQLPDVSEGEDFTALGPSLARLSPGIEDRKLFVGEDWLLDFPQASTEDFRLSGLTAEDFEELKSPAGSLDSSEEKFELLLELVGSGSAEEVTDSDRSCYPDTVDWLTRTTIAPDHLDLTAASECVETVVRKEKKQVGNIQKPIVDFTLHNYYVVRLNRN